nr:hypothetical protein [Tanacetum cinerariifolium]
PLPEDFPTASEERFPLLSQKDATAEEVCTVDEVKVIEFDDSYEAPQEVADIGSASEGSANKKGRTVAVTTEDMQKRRNNVKARTTLLLALPDEHQLRFSKYKTAQELWAAILKTFGGNEATKKTKKNQLKPQYGNFKAEKKETLEQTFNRLQAIISHPEFMDVEIEQDDLNQKLLTSLAPKWLMHTIVWRNRSDLDTMSLDDLYNHLKVYEPEVQKKSDSQNMAFISSAKNSSGNGEVNTASIPTASTQVSPASANVTAASISLDTAYTLASQSNGSQIKYEDINQIDEDDIEEMDIKWNMTLLSMRADRFWKKTGKKISIQGTDVAGFDKSKVECFNCHKIGHFARECRAPRSQDRGRRENFKQGSKVEESAPKALMAIDGVKARLVEFKNQEIKFCEKIRCLEFKVESKDNRIERLTKELEDLKKEKEGLDSKLTGFQSASKDLDTLLGSQRPSPSIESNSINLQNSDSSVSENEESSESIMSKPMIKFVKAANSPTVINTNKDETVKKPSVKYAEMYRKTSKSSNVRGLFKENQQSELNLEFQEFPLGNSKNKIDDKGYWDSGCSRHMTGNISYHSDYEPFDRGYVSFGQGGCKITGKGTIKTGKLEFENVYFVKDLKYNLFSVSQICDNKNSVLFTDSECIVLGRDFKLIDDTNVLLRTPRQHNMYSIDLNNIVSHKDLTCLVSKASADESELWHKRLGLLGLIFSKLRMRLGILRNFIIAIENLKDLKNGVAERINRTLIEAARTMLADAKLLVTFWAEAVNTACYVQNRVLVNKSQNKTPYELFNGTKDAASHDVKKDVSSLRYIVLPNWFHEAYLESSTSNAQDACKVNAPESSRNSNPTATSTNPPANQIETLIVETPIPTVSSPVLTVCLDDSPQLSSDTRLISKRVTSQDDTPSLDNILTLSNRFKDILGVTTNTGDTNGVEADLSNMENNISASLTSTFRIHKDHPTSQIISSVDTPVQTRNKSKKMEEQGFIASIHHKTNPDLLQFCLFSCFLSQKEPKKIFDALKDPMVRPFGTKWVLKNKKDERGIVIRNKARLVAQGHTQEEGIDYEEVFAPVTRIKAIRLFLAYAFFMGFTVYQIDAKSVFLYGTIDEEVYVMQPSGFQDPEFPARVYKVEKAMYGLHQAPRAWYGTLSKYLLTNGFQRGTIDQTLFIRKHKGDFLLVQVCQVSTYFHGQGESLGKRQNWHQVTPKECHLHVVKRIFRYLKSHPKLGIWYPKDSPFDLVAYSDSDYGSATQDRKSTTGGCQFLGRRLISWQCKKQIIMATSTTEAEYVATASGCGQVMWIQNQLLDYRYALTINPTVYVLHIRQFWSTARVEASDEGTKILATVDGTPTEPHHTPSPEAPQSPQHDLSSSIHPPVTTATLPTVIPTDNPLLRQYFRRARIAQSLALSSAADEPISPLGDDSPASLKAKIKLLEDKDGGGDEPSGEDATIKGKSLEIEEEEAVEKRVQVVSVPPATISVPTGSGMVPTTSSILTTASVVTPYARRKGKEKMLAKEDQRMNEQIARDAEIARIHVEEELQMLIDSLDRNNKTVTKYLQEYEQFVEDLSIGERIELINDPVKYQDNYAKLLKFQSQQRKPLSKKQQREFYMSFLKSHSGWKTKHFKGMSLEERERNGLRLEQDNAKKVKTSEEVSEEDLKEVSEEDLKTMMQLVLVEEETLSIRQATSDKEKELWVEPKRLYKPDVEDQLDEFPLLEDFPTTSEERFPLLSQKDATAKEVCTADEVK